MGTLLFRLVDGDALLDKRVEADVLTFLSGNDRGWRGLGLEQLGRRQLPYPGRRVPSKCAVGVPARNVGVALGVQQRRAGERVRRARVSIRHDQRHILLLRLRRAKAGRKRKLGCKQLANGSVLENGLARDACCAVEGGRGGRGQVECSGGAQGRSWNRICGVEGAIEPGDVRVLEPVGKREQARSRVGKTMFRQGRKSNKDQKRETRPGQRSRGSERE